MRTIAKLLLSSQFGKYIQKPDFGTTKFYYHQNIDQLHDYLIDPHRKVTDFLMMSSSVILVQYNMGKHLQAESEFTNPAIGGLITTYRGIKLYETLERLQEKVMYYDTNSGRILWGTRYTPVCHNSALPR